jgi:hypothetical protein
MKFSELIGQVRTWLERDQQVSYRALKREFNLEDEAVEDLKAELIDAKRLAVDENGRVLVWVGDTPVPRAEVPPPPSTQPPVPKQLHTRSPG